MQIFLLQSQVFLSSFLLFQIELVLGKLLLPGFGGGYLVWGISMVFYQGVLLLGYLHLHALRARFRFEQYKRWHTVVLLLSLFCLPLRADRLLNPDYHLSPVIEIVYLLAITIGPLFFILAGLSIYIQLHLAASDLPEKENPYILYAASNLGAFAALLAYPFLIEPYFDSSTQLLQWEIGYAVLAFLYLVILRAVPTGKVAEPEGIAWPEGGRVLQWILLSAAPSAMFLAVTNLITFDIAPVPLLWIPPLAIYLLTLALGFKMRPYCPRWIQDRFYLALHIGTCVYLLKFSGYSIYEHLLFVMLQLRIPYYFIAVLAEPVLQLGICFVFCLVCHCRLNESRPQNPASLTVFYIAIAAGGFLGGALVNWAVPLVFNTPIELLLAFLLAVLAFALADKKGFRLDYPLIGISAGVAGLALLLVNVVYLFGKDLGGGVLPVLWIGILILLFLLRDKHYRVAWTLGCLVLLSLFADRLNFNLKILEQRRDYYGIYKVYEEDGFRFLKHGTTVHGAQFTEGPQKSEALTYYHKESPVGEFLLHNPLNYSRIALVGLGAGSLAVYARPGDEYDFFELDPLVGELAQKYFTFIPDSRAKIRIVYGDARVSLRKEDSAKYDALIVDVFNSGSIPVHLVTVEAVREFRRNLKPNGIIFFHVSNQFLDIVPVLYAVGKEAGLNACIKWVGAKNTPERESATWLALAADPGVYNFLRVSGGWRNVNPPAVKPWTDRYSSIVTQIY